MVTKQSLSPYVFVRSCIYAFIRACCVCVWILGGWKGTQMLSQSFTQRVQHLQHVTSFRDFCFSDDRNGGLTVPLTFPPWMSRTLVLFCCKMALGAKQGSGCGLLSPRRSESKQVNQVQLNKHALSKRKFPVQSASFHFTAGVHLECHCICWDHLHDDRT